jgi:hypothetical protein
MNTKLLVLAIAIALLLYILIQPKKEKFANKQPLKDTVEFKTKLRTVIANQYSIDESRIQNIVIDPNSQKLSFTISNATLDGTKNSTTINDLERLINGAIQDGTMAFNIDGNIVNLSSLDGRAMVVSDKTIVELKESFTNQYIDNYNPMYDNIDIAKAAHHVMDKYNYAPLDNELTEFIKLEYDKNMKLKAVDDTTSYF